MRPRSWLSCALYLGLFVSQAAEASGQDRVNALQAKVSVLERQQEALVESIDSLKLSYEAALSAVFPVEMVVAFDGECPQGWVEYGRAQGRLIVGVTEDYPLGQTGGEEKHRLTAAEIPDYELAGEAAATSHTHPVYVQFSVSEGGDWFA